MSSRPQIINVGEDVEPKEHCTLLLGIQIYSATLKKSISVHQETKNRTTMCLVAQLCPILCYSMDHVVHGKNTGVGCHALLQGIFPSQELNWCLLHYRQILYLLSYQGSNDMIKNMIIAIWSSNSTPGYISEENKNSNSDRLVDSNTYSRITKQ